MCDLTVKKHEKLNYMNVLRAIAIVIIVLGHSYSKSCADSSIGKILFEILENGTVLFVFISGFLFQYLSDKFKYKTYLKKKFINVIMPYIITSLFGIAILWLFPNNNPYNELNKIIQLPIFLTTGHCQNMYTWYIPMITIIFFMAKILLKLENIKILGKPLLYVLLPFLLIITIVFPRYPFFPNNDYSLFYFYLLNLKTIFIRVLQFLPVYILGMCFSYNRQYIPKLFNIKYILIALMTFSAIISVSSGFNNGNISKIFMTLFLLGFFAHYDYAIIAKSKLNSYIDLIANYSFAIFFVHYYLLLLVHDIYKFGFHINDIVLIKDMNSFILWLQIGTVKFVFGFFGSLFICICIKKLLTKIGFKNTRWFIGV